MKYAEFVQEVNNNICSITLCEYLELQKKVEKEVENLFEETNNEKNPKTINLPHNPTSPTSQL